MRSKRQMRMRGEVEIGVVDGNGTEEGKMTIKAYPCQTPKSGVEQLAPWRGGSGLQFQRDIIIAQESTANTDKGRQMIQKIDAEPSPSRRNSIFI